MGNNDTESNFSEYIIEEVIEDPGSASLFRDYPPWLLYFAAGCCVLFMSIGIPGNLITVAALFRTKKVSDNLLLFGGFYGHRFWTSAPMPLQFCYLRLRF